jgi:septum site-determining protein MinC
MEAGAGRTRCERGGTSYRRSIRSGLVTLLRGRKQGLEIALAGREFGDALDELQARLAERPGFYRGVSAIANFGSAAPSPEEFARLQNLLADAGIELRALAGSGEVEAVAAASGHGFEPITTTGELERRRALRTPREARLSEAARSLVADFAGARADIADRRRRGEASVRRTDIAPDPPPAEPPALHLVEAPPATLYHTATLRGGQTLHHVGHIVVVGDVNPGAELIASGDILVFGRLAGVAHAGAHGDEAARVYALDLDATQLRIATYIAADERSSGRSSRPEAALIRDGRIAIVPHDRLGDVERGAPLS